MAPEGPIDRSSGGVAEFRNDAHHLSGRTPPLGSHTLAEIGYLEAHKLGQEPLFSMTSVANCDINGTIGANGWL